LYEANALTFQNDNNEIYTCNWGPYDTGLILDGPGPLLSQVFRSTVQSGRKGKGSIYVWAAGNGQQNQDNANYDGYVNAIETIAVCSVDDHGVHTRYSEPGACLVVCAPSSNGFSFITTTEVLGPGEDGCTSGFGGTSASGPIVAGVVALMLEANTKLHWRDVQAILIHSARKNDPHDSDWVTNAHGLPVNHKYGFGVVDAAKATILARDWKSLPE
jgi:kexin